MSARLRAATGGLTLCLVAACVQAQTTPRFDGERKRDPPLAPQPQTTAMLPPYRLALSPPGEGDESRPLQLQAQPTAAVGNVQSDLSCSFSIRPDRGTGATWTTPPDPGCTRLHTQLLPAGAYWARLTVRWRARGEAAVREDTHELPYKVRVADRLRLLSLRLEPVAPETGVPAKLAWELENIGPNAVQPMAVDVLRNGQVVARRTRDRLAPREIWRDAWTFTPDAAGSTRFALVADPDNLAGETEALRANNRAERSADIGAGPPPVPLLLVGPIETMPGPAGARATIWARRVTICNVDPQAFYRIKVDGPTCVGLPCSAPYNGSPAAGHYRPGAFQVMGSWLDPGCPAGLAFSGGLDPGVLQGPIGSVHEHHFEVGVVAERNGRRSPGASIGFTVAPNCRPPCVDLQR